VHGIAKLATSGNLPYALGQTLDFTRCASEAFVSGMKNLKVPRSRLRVHERNEFMLTRKRGVQE
jgi:hypothetical protein